MSPKPERPSHYVTMYLKENGYTIIPVNPGHDEIAGLNSYPSLKDIKEKIDVPYSCHGGVCSTCIARVTKGTAVMEKNEILTNSEVEEGLILTCQAHATSSEIELDYDDV